MNLPCKVVEDLLPLYFDCLCSDETAELVEAHLKECPQCSRLLSKLQAELEVEKETVDDLKPLTALQKKWQKSRRTNISKGICVALAAVTAVVGVLAGTWYFRYGKTFDNMAENMQRTVADAPDTDSQHKDIASSDYQKEINGYLFDLWLPHIFHEDGCARVLGPDGLAVFIYPEAGGKYSWKLYITDEAGRSRMVYLKEDLSVDFENYDTLLRAEKEQEKVRQLVAQKYDEIAGMLEAVEMLWGIDLREYSY